MNWFESLTGFGEGSPEQVRAGFVLHEDALVSRANGRRLVFGRLETPSLAQLRERAGAHASMAAGNSWREVVGDARALHADAANAGALFQVASQFNLLEMVSPALTPEHGVGRYESDPTQGPACAIACGAGTIYRNYFIPLNGRIGQSHDNQIDCLADLGAALGNQDGRHWNMRNGYALASEEGLREVAERLRGAADGERDRLRGLLRVGVQWGTEVTLSGCTHRVSQVYCSALPVAYSRHDTAAWEPLARLVLEATYEATLCVALENARRGGSRTVFLTQVGGGAFGNPKAWIDDAIAHARARHPAGGLDLALVRRSLAQS